MIRTSISILVLVSLLIGGSGCSSLRSEKEIRHAIQADYSVTDPEFANSMSQLLEAPLVGGNDVIELLNGDQIFAAMLEAVRSAQETITFETFIWSAGQVSTQFVAALSERARA
jgi:cardiolipin synthase